MEKLFREQLDRLRTDHIDYYLMHMLTDPDTWQRLKDLGGSGEESRLRDVCESEEMLEKALAYLLRKKWITGQQDYRRKAGDKTEKIATLASSAEEAMELVAFANKYYDEQKPWVQAKEDINAFNNTIYSCAYVIANLSNIFEPFMPKSCAKIREFLNLSEKPSWETIEIKAGTKLDKVEPLFSRI